MKEKILKLRSEGKSYNEIKKILGCSKSTISYHCGDGQKEKNNIRSKKCKNKNYLINRLYHFTNRKLKVSVRDFQRRDGDKLLDKQHKTFDYNNILKKFGVETICYLSGEAINLLTDSHYQLDHIVPVKKGGKNNINNLGVLHKDINRMKGELTVDEFIEWCKKILKHNGYEIKKVR